MFGYFVQSDALATGLGLPQDRVLPLTVHLVPDGQLVVPLADGDHIDCVFLVLG
jgi:hypothetical protein